MMGFMGMLQYRDVKVGTKYRCSMQTKLSIKPTATIRIWQGFQLFNSCNVHVVRILWLMIITKSMCVVKCASWKLQVWITKRDSPYENLFLNSSDCECDMEGSLHSTCDNQSGDCECQPYVTGRQCDVCEYSYWGFSNTGMWSGSSTLCLGVVISRSFIVTIIL